MSPEPVISKAMIAATMALIGKHQPIGVYRLHEIVNEHGYTIGRGTLQVMLHLLAALDLVQSSLVTGNQQRLAYHEWTLVPRLSPDVSSSQGSQP